MNGERANRTYLVVGLGRFGTALCERLSAAGAHVIAVDRVRARVDELSDRLEYVAQLDATDEAALVKVGANTVDTAVVCLGEKTEATILVTAILKDIGVPNIVARATNDLQARILNKIGAHRIVAPEAEMGKRIADMLEHPWLDHFADLGDDNHVTGRVPAFPEMIGRSLKELSLPARFGCTVMILERGGKKIMPHADLVILEGDRIWLFGDRQRMAPLLERVTGGEEEKPNRED